MPRAFTEKEKNWLEKNNYSLQRFLGTHDNSCVWLVSFREREYVIKVQHSGKGKWLPLAMEEAALRMSNEEGIGPRVIQYITNPEILVLDFVKGKRFTEWLETNPSPDLLKKILSSLAKQAKKLNEMGIDHYGLDDPHKSIRITPENNPVILDFDESDFSPKPKNGERLEKVLWAGRTNTAQKIREMVGEEWISPF